MNFFKYLVLLTALASALTACGGKEERKAKYLERGKLYLEEGNFDKARIEFKNVAQIDPKAAQAFLYLGKVEEEEKEWAKAFSNYKRAIDLDPVLVEPRVVMARLYLWQASANKSRNNLEGVANMLGLAKEQMDAVLSMEPENLGGLSVQAAVWIEEGETEKASKQLRRILQENPGENSAAFMLSSIYTKLDQHGAAEEVLLSALPKTDDLVAVRIRLVQFYGSTGKNEKAEGLLRELIQDEPENLRYRVSLASFLVKNNDLDGAEQALRDAIAIDPNDESRYLLLADFQFKERNVDTAINELEVAQKVHPEFTKLQFGLIDLYQKNKQIDKVHKGLEKIISVHGIEPDGLKARVAMAQLLASQDKEIDRVNKLLSEVLLENPQDGTALMLRGHLAGKDKRWVDAINDFRSVLKSAPDSIDALKFLASAHLANNEMILAKDTLKKGLDVAPLNTAMRLQLASILINENSYDIALSEINKVIEVDPGNQQALNRKFDLLALKGDVKGMGIIAKTLQEEAPDSEVGFINEARLLFSQKDFEGSMSMADNVLANNPSSIMGLLLKSDIYAMQENYADALKAVRELQKTQPNAAVGFYREAKLLTAQDNKSGALVAYQKALKKAPSSVEILTELSSLQIQEGRSTDAINHLQGILAGDAKHPAANSLLGIAYMNSKDFPKAEEAFSRQITINPDSATSYVQLATARAAQKNETGAMKAYQDGLIVNPDNARLILGLAGLEEQQKNYDAAIGYYEQLLDKQPENAVGVNNLAALLSDHKDDASSISKAVNYAKILEKAKQPVFKDTAAWVYYKSGDTEKALALATAVVDEMPDVPIFNYHLGMIYVKTGDTPNARKYLSEAVKGEDFVGIDSARSALEKL